MLAFTFLGYDVHESIGDIPSGSTEFLAIHSETREKFKSWNTRTWDSDRMRTQIMLEIHAHWINLQLTLIKEQIKNNDPVI